MCCTFESTSRLLRTLIPVNVQKPLLDVGVIMADHLEVTPEESMVANIETNNCREETDIRFRQMLAEDERTFILS